MPDAVSADDVVALIAAYADRMHDAIRRLGCPPSKAADVLERSALELLATLQRAPETVEDLLGWWLARIADNTARLTGKPNAGLAATVRRDRGEAVPGVLHGTRGARRLTDALNEMDPRARTAVLLRDSYDLPTPSLAVALRRDEIATRLLVAQARRELLTGYGDDPTPLDSAHTGGAAVDAGALALLADGSLPPADAGPLRRHSKRCPTCQAILEDQTRARRLAAALPLLPLPEGARDELVGSVAARATAVLPSSAELLYAAPGRTRRRPLINPLVIVGSVAVAIVLGIVVGLASAPSGGLHTASGPGGGRTSPTSPTSGSPSPSITAKQSKSATPTASATSSAPAVISTSVSPTTSPTGSATSQPASYAAISVFPDRGPNGRTITVVGTGWKPGVDVTVSYYTALGGPSSQAVATPNSNGRFSVNVAAEDPTLVPGRHRIVASNGSQSATAYYNASS